MITPIGKGIYIWKLGECERGDFAQIVSAAEAAGLKHVLIKIANGTSAYNGEYNIAVLAGVLKKHNIQVWGWQYVYGVNPVLEAETAIDLCRRYELDGFVIDAEKEFKTANGMNRADAYARRLRSGLDIPIALSSYRYPSLHPEFPWRVFRKYIDFDMPQVYWEGAHNPGVQLAKSHAEFAALTPKLPYIPTGAAYRRGLWVATAEDVRQFMAQAEKMGLPGVNFWEWAPARKLNLWSVIAGYPYSPATPAPAPGPTVDLEAIRRELEYIKGRIAAIESQLSGVRGV